MQETEKSGSAMRCRLIDLSLQSYYWRLRECALKVFNKFLSMKVCDYAEKELESVCNSFFFFFEKAVIRIILTVNDWHYL